FWEETRRRLEKIKPDIGMLAESDSSDEQLYAFDVSYGFGWFRSLRRVFVDGEPAITLEETWKDMNQRFPTGSRFIRWTDNHDQFRPEIVFSKKGSMAANVLNFTIDGVPFIYNGQEIGDASPYGIMYYPEKSYNDNGAINWNAQFIPHQKDLRNWYKKLIALRKNEKALLEGETLWLKTNNPESAIAFLRKTDDESIMVVLNVSNRKIKVKVELQNVTGGKEIKPENLFFPGKDEIINLTGKDVTLSLGSFGYYVGKL
ncbi:MAG: alpha-glucosidase C-terminal domain-containing protein, partial [Fermentimonas sp.]